MWTYTHLPVIMVFLFLFMAVCHKCWTLQQLNTECSENVREKWAYRVLGGRQDLFDHHAVSGEGAAVEGVGPIRTKGAQAVGIYSNTIQCGGDWKWNTHKTHTHIDTNTKTLITACNFQGKWCTKAKGGVTLANSKQLRSETSHLSHLKSHSLH